MPPNPWLVASGVSIIGLGLAHTWLGERYIVARLLRRDNLPKLFGADAFTKRTLRYAWHLTTLLAWTVGGLLLWAATAPAETEVRAPVLFVAAGLAASAAWGLVATRGRHLSWIVLAFAAVASAWGVH